ncbi:hypothetical protein Ddc_23736 [Ditylenchus destructor]|nr:hypothetical protein Ddc_23736 [Ditylenchus destructor]
MQKLQGGLTRRQLEEKLGNCEAQLLKSSERIKELEVASVELYKSEARNRELLESNRNLEAKLGQLDLNRLKVIIKEFSDNLENTEIYRSENLHNTMSAELEAKQHRQGEIVTNTEKSGNMFGIFATEMFHRYPAEEDE